MSTHGELVQTIGALLAREHATTVGSVLTELVTGHLAAHEDAAERNVLLAAHVTAVLMMLPHAVGIIDKDIKMRLRGLH